MVSNVKGLKMRVFPVKKDLLQHFCGYPVEFLFPKFCFGTIGFRLGDGIGCLEPEAVLATMRPNSREAAQALETADSFGECELEHGWPTTTVAGSAGRRYRVCVEPCQQGEALGARCERLDYLQRGSLCKHGAAAQGGHLPPAG